MAETTETVVFEVDVSSYEKSLAELTKSINTLKTSQKDLQEQTKQGAEGAAESLEKVNAELKVQQQQYRTTQNVLVGYIGSQQKGVDMQKLSNNSIQTNRDLLKQLTAQIINLKNPNEALKKQVKDVSDELKRQEAALGDTRRNVGNYAGGFKDAFNAIAAGIPGLKGFQTAQLGVNAAMNANPVGAVVFALQGLYEIFSQNAEIADAVSFAFAAVNKAVGSIIDTVVNTVSSLDNLTNALAHPIDFIVNLGKNMATAAKEGYAAAQALDAFELSAGRIDRSIQQNNKSIEANTKLLKDKTQSEKERIRIANLIADTEIANADLEIKKAKELESAEKLRLKGKTLTAKEQNELEQKTADVTNAILEKQTVNAQRQTRINILLDKQASENKVEVAKQTASKQLEIALKSAADLDAVNKKKRDDAAKVYEDETNKLLDAEVKRAQITAERVGSPESRIDAEIIARTRLLQNEKLNAIERENIIRESEDRIQKIKEDSAAKQTATQEKLQKDQIAAVSGIVGNAVGVLSEISSALDADIKDKELALKDALANGTITQKKYAEESKKLKKKQFEETKAVAIVSAILQGVNATLAAYTSGAAIPIVGAVTGPLFAGLAAAFAAVQVGLVSAQQPPAGFAKGVIGLKGAGTGTSDSIDAKLSKGESVITAKATERYHHILADMERSVGNTPNYNFSSRRFATGVIGIPTSDGGFSTREISNNVNNSLQLKQAIREGFAKAPAPELSIVELNNKQNSRRRSISISEA